ncbi:MAG: restriction endonuclease [Candidatus Moranbacteria bacterium]|jgi:restriction system protein|nr:restriction endonuclease [Candidatus Moranbacteria bacterium]
MSKKKIVEKIASMIFALYVLVVFVKIMPLLFSDIYKAIIYFLIAVFLPLLIVAIYQKRRKKIFFDSKKTLESIRDLKPDQFEEFICNLFNKLGYSTEKVGGPNDGGIDVIATKNGVKHYIQCKKFITRQVSVGEMRDFYGAVVDKLNDAKSFFITTNVFTLEAERFALGKPIELIDGKKLMEYVNLAGLSSDNVVGNGSIFDSSIIEKCPDCGGKLVLRTARKGSYSGNDFYGCSNYPKCKFIKNK